MTAPKRAAGEPEGRQADDHQFGVGRVEGVWIHAVRAVRAVPAEGRDDGHISGGGQRVHGQLGSRRREVEDHALVRRRQEPEEGPVGVAVAPHVAGHRPMAQAVAVRVFDVRTAAPASLRSLAQ